MSDDGNGDWSMNKKLVLQGLLDLKSHIRDVAQDANESSMARHRTVVDKLGQLEDRMDEREKTIDERFVTKDEFGPVSKLAYGLAGLILSGTVIALLALLFNGVPS